MGAQMTWADLSPAQKERMKFTQRRERRLKREKKQKAKAARELKKSLHEQLYGPDAMYDRLLNGRQFESYTIKRRFKSYAQLD